MNWPRHEISIGGGSLTAAIRWEDGLVQHTPHDQRRIVREGDRWFHQVRWSETGEWFDVCEFTGEEMQPIDRELANWWTSAHPDSRFRNNLIVGAAGLDGSRRTLFNREFTFRPRFAEAVKQEIASRTELAEVLQREFHLTLPAEASLSFLKFGTEA